MRSYSVANKLEDLRKLAKERKGINKKKVKHKNKDAGTGEEHNEEEHNINYGEVEVDEAVKMF